MTAKTRCDVNLCLHIFVETSKLCAQKRLSKKRHLHFHKEAQNNGHFSQTKALKSYFSIGAPILSGIVCKEKRFHSIRTLTSAICTNRLQYVISTAFGQIVQPFVKSYYNLAIRLQFRIFVPIVLLCILVIYNQLVQICWCRFAGCPVDLSLDLINSYEATYAHILAVTDEFLAVIYPRLL